MRSVIPVRRLAAAASLVVLAVACTGPRSGVVEISGAMPAISGATVQSGGSISPADYKGKVVVVNLWASWCEPCRLEEPILEATWQKVQGQGVYFIGIDARDDPAAGAAFVRQYGLTYPSVPDASGRLAYDFGFWGVPGTVVIDRQGQMRYRRVGQIDQAQLDQMLAGVGVKVGAGLP